MQLSTLSELIDLDLKTDKLASIHIAGISYDSRHTQQGDIFLACPGSQADGRAYIQQAIEKGAVAVLAEQNINVPSISYDTKTAVPIISVSNLAHKLGTIAARFYQNPSTHMDIIGVTGTNGKTSVTNYISQGFNLVQQTSGVIGTLGYGINHLTATGITTPNAVQLQQLLHSMLEQSCQHVALEASSHAIAQKRIKAVDFNTLVFTNLSQDHLDYHADMETYQAVKFSLFSDYLYKNAVINLDDTSGKQLFTQLKVPKLSYSLSQTNADIHVSAHTITSKGFAAEIATPKGKISIQSSLIGEFNLSNLLAAIAVWQLKGLSNNQISNIVSQIQAVSGRMQLIQQTGQPSVVIDYAHTPDALEKSLAAIQSHCKGKLYCVFGCGGNRDKSKRPLMGAIAAKLADIIVVTSDNPRDENPDAIIGDIIAGITDKTQLELLPDRSEAIKYAINSASVDDWILIAGKGHESYQEVVNQKIPFSDYQQVTNAFNKQT